MITIPPLVSVIIPVFRAEIYIEKCARSLFGQTLRNIEYVFVNDASDDDSVGKIMSILEDYPERKPNVKIIDLPENAGVANARAIGMKSATGNYFIHCDSDDWVDERMYEKMYDYAVKNQFDVCLCDYRKTNGENSIDIKSKIGYGEFDKTTIINKLLRGDFHGSLCRTLINRKLLNNDIIYPTGNMCEDTTILMQMLYYSKRIGWMDETCYNYFYNNQSITKKKTKESDLNKFYQRKKNVETMIRFAQKHSLEYTFRTGLLMQQFYCKRYLFCYLWDNEVAKQYHMTFPDMEAGILSCKETPIRYRVSVLFVKLGIIPVVSNISKLKL